MDILSGFKKLSSALARAKQMSTASIGGPIVGLASATGLGNLLKGPTISVVNEPKDEPKIEKITATTTNYDPYDPNQTRPAGLGVGSAGIKMSPRMIAVSRKGPDSSEPIWPYGTILKDKSGQTYLVADIKNKRYHSSPQIDFAVPYGGSKIIPELNTISDFEVVEMGKGILDARKKATRFQ